MPHTARPFVVHEANLRQLRELRPNVAVLPWGATEAHNYHLPYGTDVVEATETAERAVQLANERGARCALLPCVPFGIDHTQLYQVATITMRAATQQAVLYDVADSLVRQGIDRLVVFNFHGGNEFKSMIRDVMLDLPIFIVQFHGFQPMVQAPGIIENRGGDHADECETSMMLHLRPDWVAPLETAGPGTPAPNTMPALTATPGVWYPRDWQAYTADTGVGNPYKGTADKGEKLFNAIVQAIVPGLVELSNAEPGEFPFIIRRS